MLEVVEWWANSAPRAGWLVRHALLAAWRTIVTIADQSGRASVRPGGLAGGGSVDEEFRSILLGTAGLTVAALAAVLLARIRARVSSSRSERRAAARVAAAAVLVQCAHFGEELAAGFHRLFPEQLGLAPGSPTFFVSFNLFWLAVWSLGSWGLVAGRRPALAALWFLGIAALANGVSHPLLAVRTGGYFPGLVTSPFVGVAGLLLVRQLLAVTRGRGPRGGPPDERGGRSPAW